ncbi:MAG: phytanoyl-CoA dioxygenase family protein [Xenococcaceae cyanobacterium]
MKNISIEDLSVNYSTTDEKELAQSDLQAKQLLDEFGCFLAQGLLAKVELDLVRNEIRQLIELRMKRVGLPIQPSVDNISDFDYGFQILSQLESTYVREFSANSITQASQLEYAHSEVIMNACRTLLSIHQINVNPKLVRLSKRLMETNTLMNHLSYDLRVDRPYDDESLFPWHQDYPVIQDSEDALVYWLPLRDVGLRDGCLAIAPQSHKLGVLPQYWHSQDGEVSATIPDRELLSQFPCLRVPVNAGDVLVFNTLLLHASGVNRSDRIRWTLQVRHGNFEHPKAIARNWPNSSVWNVPFHQSHPEYVKCAARREQGT